MPHRKQAPRSHRHDYSMTEWIPRLADFRGPRYLAIVDALSGDITAGRISVGTRLLPQRDMAARLGISVGTVSKAYAEAEKRGLISGEVGRGTFVRAGGAARRSHEIFGKSLNLALNIPPSTGEDELIAQAMADIAVDNRIGDLLGYLPHQGSHEHRSAVSGWLDRRGVKADIDSLFITNGAQHALSIAASMLVASGETMLTENLTYSGMLALSIQSGFRLHGIEMDSEGLLPAAVERALERTNARALYAMPTLQTPTGAVLGIERRREIAAILRRHDAFLIEDDAYSFLLDDAPPPISSFIPERSFYVMSFAKCLAPGLRVGAMTAPDSFRDRTINALRATGWMAAPPMVEVVVRLLADGGLAEQVRRKRDVAARRNAIANRVLEPWLVPAPPTSFHVWLSLPAGRTVTALISQAAMENITLVAPVALRPQHPVPEGMRLCLGAPHTEDELEKALLILRDILKSAEAVSMI